ATRGIEDTINHGDRGGKRPTNRGFGPHLASAADSDFSIASGWHEHLNTKLVDLGERQDRALLISILTRDEMTFHDYAIDRTSQGTLVYDLLGVLDLELCNFRVEGRFFQLLLGNVGFGLGFLQSGKGAHLLGMQLTDALMLSTQELHPSLR